MRDSDFRQYRTAKLIVQFFTAIILSFAFNHPLSAEEDCTVSSENCTVIMMVGDSITFGTGVDNSERPGIGRGQNRGPSVLELQRLLNESQRPSLILNWGIGGSSSFNGVERINKLLNESLGLYPATKYFTLIQLGTNDEDFGISSTTTGSNVLAIAAVSRQRGVIPVVALIPPRSDENVSARNQAINNEANSDSVPVVDNFSIFNANSLSTFFVNENGKFVHPNQAGYDVIASNWFNQAMQSLIDPTPPEPEPEPEPIPIVAPFIGLLLDDD